MTANLAIMIAAKAGSGPEANQPSLAGIRLRVVSATQFSSLHSATGPGSNITLESFASGWLRLLHNLDSIACGNQQGTSAPQSKVIEQALTDGTDNASGTASAIRADSNPISTEEAKTALRTAAEDGSDTASASVPRGEIASTETLLTKKGMHTKSHFTCKENAQAASADKWKHPDDRSGPANAVSSALPGVVMPWNMPAPLSGELQVRVDQEEQSPASPAVFLHEVHGRSVPQTDMQPASQHKFPADTMQEKATSTLPSQVACLQGQSRESAFAPPPPVEQPLTNEFQKFISTAGSQTQIDADSPASMKQELHPTISTTLSSHLPVAAALSAPADLHHAAPSAGKPLSSAKQSTTNTERRDSSEGELEARQTFTGAHLVLASHPQATVHGIPVMQSSSGNSGSQVDLRAATPSALRTDPQSTFNGLDRGDVNSGASWIHGDTHHAEAGFQDPALGWIGVKAETVSGSIHASLIASTSDAAQALGGHLAGLNAYMADRYSTVHNITVAASDSTAAWTANQEANSGAGQHPHPGDSHNEDRNQSTRSDFIRGAPSLLSSTTSVADTRTISTALGILSGNSAARVISVIA